MADDSFDYNAWQRERARRIYAERKAAGMCLCCGKPPVPGYKSCAKKLAQDRAAQRRRYAKRRPK